MKKLFTIFTVVAITSTVSFSQISDRENDESTYLLGARPVAGNFGFFLGASLGELEEMVDQSWEESGIPLINLKYYFTDKLVLKGGVQIAKKRRSLEGDFSAVSVGEMSSYKHVETDANWNFQLGAEKHFDLSNIIDGYIGLNGNVGYERSVRTTNMSFNGGDYNDSEGSSFGFTYGLETVIGTNFFIADLPIAIGFEGGFSAKNYGANKFKSDWDVRTAGVVNSGTYYTSLIDDFEDDFANDPTQLSGQEFTELKARRFDILPVARFTLTYYLKR